MDNQQFQTRFTAAMAVLRQLGVKCQCLVNRDGVFIVTTDKWSAKQIRRNKKLTETKVKGAWFFCHILEAEAKTKQYLQELLEAA